MIKFSGKKGVSPIIAAVLLVVITIAIGATTMAFIRSLTDSNLQTASEQSTKIACGSDLKLEIPVVQNNYKICYYNETGGVNVLFHNTGSIDVNGFLMSVILTNGSVYTFVDTSSVPVSNYVNVNLTTNLTSLDAESNVAQWRIESKIKGSPGKGDTICADVAIVRDSGEIDAC